VDEFAREFKASKRLTDARHTIHITILAAVTLAIGIYLISTTVLIAKDGTLYIEIAKKMSGGIMEIVRATKQAPGYPFLIYLMHKAIGLFYNAQSLQGWIVSAQAVSLLSKLIAAIALYFVGSYFVGSRFSFWGVLILSLLPDSLDFGSDALTDWPSMMFLAIGFLLLLLGAEYRKLWLWGLAGISAGLGYLIRPECGQVVLYGSVWLLFNLVRPQGRMKRLDAAGPLMLLLVGFAVVALPYMKCKGYVFPERYMWKLPVSLKMNSDNLCLAGMSIGKVTGSAKLINNICETLVYYFVPALAIGGYYYFRKQPKTSAQVFFIAAFILVNVTMALLLLSYNGYLSRRHTLPLVAFTIFFIPIGLYIMACWLNRRNFKEDLIVEKNTRCLFFMLMVIGICICAVKIVRMSPLRWEKHGYREAAKWLDKYTTPADIIAVPDKRIAFYAGRIGIVYETHLSRNDWNYLVRIEKDSEAANSEEKRNLLEKLYSCPLEKSRHYSRQVVVYRRTGGSLEGKR
jgi:hypothetical protein